eukprot:6670039-Prymnesium_polylepis.1
MPQCNATPDNPGSCPVSEHSATDPDCALAKRIDRVSLRSAQRAQRPIKRPPGQLSTTATEMLHGSTSSVVPSCVVFRFCRASAPQPRRAGREHRTAPPATSRAFPSPGCKVHTTHCSRSAQQQPLEDLL